MEMQRAVSHIQNFSQNLLLLVNKGSCINLNAIPAAIYTSTAETRIFSGGGEFSLLFPSFRFSLPPLFIFPLPLPFPSMVSGPWSLARVCESAESFFSWVRGEAVAANACFGVFRAH